MKSILYIRPDGGAYHARRAQSPLDMAITESPGPGYDFDREKMRWVINPDWHVEYFKDRAQQHLDDCVRPYFDSMNNACGYATSNDASFLGREGRCAVKYRDSVWIALEGKILPKYLAEFEAANKSGLEYAAPGWEEVKAMLPAFAWAMGCRGYNKQQGGE